MKRAPYSEHYQKLIIEPIEYIFANGWGRGFCIGNIIKYISRYEWKGGTEDLEKAQFYLEQLIKLEEANGHDA
jgi:hypothetical protein